MCLQNINVQQRRTSKSTMQDFTLEHAENRHENKHKYQVTVIVIINNENRAVNFVMIWWIMSSVSVNDGQPLIRWSSEQKRDRERHVIKIYNAENAMEKTWQKQGLRKIKLTPILK